jgi:hypothetical protein
MLPPGLQFILNAVDAFMRALLFLFVFNVIAVAWRQVFG